MKLKWKINYIYIILSLIIIFLLFYIFIYKKNKKLLILHIGKTAGRALFNSVKNEPNIKKMDHKINAFDLNKIDCDVAAVIREPIDRFISAIYWFKQGGENNDQINNTCSKFVKNKSLSEILQTPKLFEQNCHFYNNVAFRPTKSFIYGSEDKIIPICFNDLENEFIKKIKPYCKSDCTLKMRNKSKRPKIDELNKTDYEAVKKYVEYKYRNDIIYYNKKCKNN